LSLQFRVLEFKNKLRGNWVLQICSSDVDNNFSSQRTQPTTI
jgi:hypothetical protein